MSDDVISQRNEKQGHVLKIINVQASGTVITVTEITDGKCVCAVLPVSTSGMICVHTGTI